MANVGSGLLGRSQAPEQFGVPDSQDRAGQVVLRANSGRAYAFEVFPQEAVCELAEVGAVYCYARALPASTAATEASGTDLSIGYIGKTGDMGRQDSEHEARGDFAGHGFDIVLICRVEQAPMRADVRRDLIDTFNPVLNDLLRSVECGEVS